MNNESVEVLRYARDVVLGSRESWTFSALARDADGESVPVERGETFCALGAVLRSRWELTGSLGSLKSDGYPQGDDVDALRSACGRAVWGFNDDAWFLPEGRGFSDVIDMFDRGIKRLEDAS